MSSLSLIVGLILALLVVGIELLSFLHQSITSRKITTAQADFVSFEAPSQPKKQLVKAGIRENKDSES